MIRSDEQWLSITDTFHAAAIGAQSWETALRGFADATGSRSAQLTGMGQDGSVIFNVLTNIDPPAFYSLFSATASINPRVRAASASPVLKVMAEADFITPDECRRNQFYQEVARPLDIPFMCFTTLERQDAAFIALGAIRSAREEHITLEQREIFAALAPHVRTAVRTQLALEGRGAAVLTGAMDTLSIPAFVCDHSGRVGSLTQAAENLITSGRGLQLKAGLLKAYWSEEANALDDAIKAAVVWRAQPGPAVLRTVIVRAQDPESAPIVLDVFPLTFSGLSVFVCATRAGRCSRSSRLEGEKGGDIAGHIRFDFRRNSDCRMSHEGTVGGIDCDEARRRRRDRAYTDQSDHGETRRQPPGGARRTAWRVVNLAKSLVRSGRTP